MSATSSPILNKGELVQLAMKNETRVGKLAALLLCLRFLDFRLGVNSGG